MAASARPARAVDLRATSSPEEGGPRLSATGRKGPVGTRTRVIGALIGLGPSSS